MGQERGLGVENADVGGRVGRDFAVKVEDHVLLLHGFENGVVGFIGLDTAIGVRGHAPRIGLDAFVLAGSWNETRKSGATHRQCLLALPSGSRRA